jgi:hypothetical protein
MCVHMCVLYVRICVRKRNAAGMGLPMCVGRRQLGRTVATKPFLGSAVREGFGKRGVGGCSNSFHQGVQKAEVE